MKKYLFVALMTFVMIGMTSCGKEKDLTGTKWSGTVTDVDEESGVQMTTAIDIEFTTVTDGKITESLVGVATFTHTMPFTYTYDANNGKGTMSVINSEKKKTEVVEIPFTVDGNTLTAIGKDGTVIVCTKQ